MYHAWEVAPAFLGEYDQSFSVSARLPPSERGFWFHCLKTFIATIYHLPVGNAELRLSLLSAHCAANGEKRSWFYWCLRILFAVYAWKSPFPGARKLTLGSAHYLRRPCSSSASEALLAFGAGSRKSSRQRSFASIGKTRSHVGLSKCSYLSKALDWAYVPRHVLLFPCLRIIRRCVQPAKACLAM